MRPIYLHCKNVLEMLFYLAVSLILFIVLQALAVVSPAVLGIGFRWLHERWLEGVSSTAINVVMTAGVIASGLTLVNLICVVWISLRDPNPGRKIDHPELEAAAHKVADDVGVSRFRSLYTTAEINCATWYSGRGRFLLLSGIALKYLTRGELAAVIAHECGHHHHGAMLMNRVHNRNCMMYYAYCVAIGRVIRKFQRQSASSGAWQFGALTLWVLVVYVKLYQIFLSFVGNLLKDANYEYYCDEVAAKVTVQPAVGTATALPSF
jgi:Zn-dependent protease with chaperone function